MQDNTLPPEISDLISRILSNDERAFCLISGDHVPGGHPLPICRVDEGGTGVECGRADVLIVRDGMIIVRIDIVKEDKNASERAAEASAGCLFYECKDTQEPKERGPYEFAKGCVIIQVKMRLEI